MATRHDTRSGLMRPHIGSGPKIAQPLQGLLYRIGKDHNWNKSGLADVTCTDLFAKHVCPFLFTMFPRKKYRALCDGDTNLVLEAFK